MFTYKPLGDPKITPFPVGFTKNFAVAPATRFEPVPGVLLSDMPSSVQGVTRPWARATPPGDTKIPDDVALAPHGPVYIDEIDRVKGSECRMRDGRIVAVHHVFILSGKYSCAIASLASKKRDEPRFQLCSFYPNGKVTEDGKPIWELGLTPTKSALWFGFNHPNGGVTVMKIFNNNEPRSKSKEDTENIGVLEFVPRDVDDDDVEMAPAPPPAPRAAPGAPKRKENRAREEDEEEKKRFFDYDEDYYEEEEGSAYWRKDVTDYQFEGTSVEEKGENFDDEEENFKFAVKRGGYRGVVKAVNDILEEKLITQHVTAAIRLLEAVHGGAHIAISGAIKLNDRRVNAIVDWVVTKSRAKELIVPNEDSRRNMSILSILSMFSIASASLLRGPICAGDLGRAQDEFKRAVSDSKAVPLAPRLNGTMWRNQFCTEPEAHKFKCKVYCACSQLAWAIMYRLGAMVVPPRRQSSQSLELGEGTDIDKARLDLENAVDLGVGTPCQDRLIIERAAAYVAVDNATASKYLRAARPERSTLVYRYMLLCMTRSQMKIEVDGIKCNLPFYSFYNSVKYSTMSNKDRARICPLLAKVHFVRPFMVPGQDNTATFRAARFFCVCDKDTALMVDLYYAETGRFAS